MIKIIAELGQAHEGSLGIAHSYIDALSKTGVDAIKFQTHIAEAESSEFEKFRINFSYEDTTRYEYWKRMEFTLEQWAGLKNHCNDLGLEFISSPFSCAAVDLLEKINVNTYKIGSGEVENKLMIDKIAKTGKQIYLSSGMSTFLEIENTINWIKKFNNNISIFQCTSSYPILPEEWGLNIINEMKKKYIYPIGFSDHSGDIFASLSATLLGVELLEFHAVFHKEIFGPDTKASLTLDQISLLTKGVRQIEIAKKNDVHKENIEKFVDMKIIFGKSLCVNKKLSQGHTLTIDDLDAKKPAKCGISAAEYDKIIGKKLKQDLNKWDFLNDNLIH